MPIFRLIVAGAALVALLVGARTARVTAAEAQSVLTVKAASVGFGGKFKSGFWQPVQLNVVAGPQGASGHLELVVPDGDQMPVIYANEQAAKLDLNAGHEASLLLYAKSGPVASPITVQLRDERGIAWSQNLSPLLPAALPATQQFVVGVGPPIGLDEAIATIHRQPDVACQTAQVRSASELPDRWWGYEGVDTLILTTSDAEFLATIGDQQRQALLEWLALGGRIILSVGARGAELAAADSPWAALLPGEFTESVPLRERSGLETFTRSELPFDQEFFQRDRPRVTRLVNVRGEVLLDEGATAAHPLVVHSTLGLGEVIFVGLDLNHPSLAAWKGRTRLVAALLQRGQRQRDQGEREPRRGATRLGYDDVVGQLRMALDQFTGVAMVNFTTVSVLTAIYLILIGPGDFLLLSRLGWPRQVTWVTFPFVAVGVIGLAGLLAGQMHGGRVRLNQAEIIDIDLSRQVVRGTVWTHFYSPVTARDDLRLQVTPPAGVRESLQGWLSWQGLPGDSLGGLGSSQQVVLARAEPYCAPMPGRELSLEGVSVQIASSKSLSGRWWAKATLPTEARLTVDQYGLLAGEFRQPLPVELTDCILVHGEKLYRLKTLRPRQLVTVPSQSSLNLEWQLTLRRIEDSKDVSEPWNQSSTNVPRIVQMLMFHEAARGRSYTGLTHRYQPYVDLSQHVRLGRAVLVGRAAEPVARLVASTGAPTECVGVPSGGNGTRSGDGGTRSVPTTNRDPVADPAATTTWTWYRIVLPVEPQPTTQP